MDYWVILNEKLGNNQGDLRQLGPYETKRMELAGTEYGCGLYAFANANPPLFGAPAGANADFDRPGSDPLLHWKDTDTNGLATVLAKANERNARQSNKHVLLLLHQYFKPDHATGTDADGADPLSGGEGAWRTEDGWLTDVNMRNNICIFEHHVYEWFKAQFPHLKVIVSEYGADGRIGRTGAALRYSLGWKRFREWTGNDGRPSAKALKRLESENQIYRDVIEGYCL